MGPTPGAGCIRPSWKPSRGRPGCSSPAAAARSPADDSARSGAAPTGHHRGHDDDRSRPVSRTNNPSPSHAAMTAGSWRPPQPAGRRESDPDGRDFSRRGRVGLIWERRSLARDGSCRCGCRGG
jgi:hypothetical protein